MRSKSLMILELMWGLRHKELLENKGVEKGEKNLGWLNNRTRLKIRVHGIKKKSRHSCSRSRALREGRLGQVEQAS